MISPNWISMTDKPDKITTSKILLSAGVPSHPIDNQKTLQILIFLFSFGILRVTIYRSCLYSISMKISRLIHRGGQAMWAKWVKSRKFFGPILIKLKYDVKLYDINYNYSLIPCSAILSSTGHRPASLCHGPLSVMCASVCACVRLSVKFFFKHHLLWNYSSDFDEISQKCSFHGPL